MKQKNPHITFSDSFQKMCGITWDDLNCIAKDSTKAFPDMDGGLPYTDSLEQTEEHLSETG